MANSKSKTKGPNLMLKVTIKRSEWLRGEGIAPSMLFRPSDQKRCCVGFYCNALGLTDENIAGRKTIANIPLPKYCPSWALDVSGGSDIDHLYRVNDATMSETERETEITNLFARNNVQIEFVD